MLALFDATGSNFNNEILTAMKEFTKANTPYIKVAVAVGISGLFQVALTAVSKFAGRDFITCKTRNDALDYLVDHAN